MAQMSNKYPIGVQSFEKLRRENYMLVDKTAMIYDMVHTGSHFFLNRPRRFGKSLLISTLEAYFLGQKDLASVVKIMQDRMQKVLDERG